MLELGRSLPAGVLIGSEGDALALALSGSGGLRFLAREADLQRDAGKITGWRAAMGEGVAQTSGPNTGNSRFEQGLQFREGKNCGFVLPSFSSRADCFTAAVIYRSGGDARTLVSVVTGQSNNLVFLGETNGVWTVTDKLGTAALSLPRKMATGAQLALISYSGQTLALRAEGQGRSVPVKLPKMDLPGDFFMGCRSNRPGLAKTQGEMLLHEVFFWPGRSLLTSADAADAGMVAALERYFRWTY